PRYASNGQTEDLEDALAALDVDLDDGALGSRRARRPSGSSHRPLPGLPLHRPEDTGSTRAARPQTGSSVTVKPALDERARAGATSEAPPGRGGWGRSSPPPVPAAARRAPTAAPPVPARPPQKRATTDDGILIDFDDDE